MAGSYIEFAFIVPGEHVNESLECLGAAAPGGLSLEEPYVPLGSDEGVRLEAWRPSLIKLYLPADETLAERTERLRGAVARLSFEPETRERSVSDEDWAESWKEFFQVEHAGSRLVICPTWREYSPRPGEIVLILDPGMAFGTGQHPTTRLCLGALEGLVRPGMDVLDLGCGSGILSLAAAKLGARSVLALDIEPLAVEATRANARLNRIEGVVRVKPGSLDSAGSAPNGNDQCVDLIVANINARTIVRLAPAIVARLGAGGTFIGSGIIAELLDEPLLALTSSGLRVERLITDGDWRGIVGCLA